MLFLCDPIFAFCSRDLDVLSAQRIIGFFNLNYPQINGVVKSSDIARVPTRRLTSLPIICGYLYVGVTRKQARKLEEQK